MYKETLIFLQGLKQNSPSLFLLMAYFLTHFIALSVKILGMNLSVRFKMLQSESFLGYVLFPIFSVGDC